MESLTLDMILVMFMIGLAIFLFIVEWVRVGRGCDFDDGDPAVTSSCNPQRGRLSVLAAMLWSPS